MRLTKVYDRMKEENLDALFIKNRNNIRYITGFTGDAGIFYLDKKQGVLVTDGRFTEQATQEIKPLKVLEYKGSIWEELADLAKDAKRVGFDGNRFNFEEYAKLCKLMPDKDLVSVDLDEIRIIKEKAELENLATAAKIADEAFTKLLPQIQKGMTEKELAARLEYYMKNLGSDKTSFDTIVASGPRSALPHAQPTDRVLEVGDFVTFDFGAMYKGYHSDMTRTVLIGMARDWHKEIYGIVEEAQRHGVAAAKVGMMGQELDALVRKEIADKGYDKFFIHGTGHGVGLEIHELPNINKLGTKPLETNMVFSVEPGIYIPGQGGVRIEDTVVLTEAGAHPLNSIGRQLIEII